MIYPHEILNHNRTNAELQELLIFCICAAGKRSGQQAVKVEIFLTPDRSKRLNCLPFTFIKGCTDRQLLFWMKYAGLGQYTKLMKAFRQVVELDVRTCTLDQLEGVHGIGPKTARFFLMMSRPNQRHAILDTHILKWLNSEHGIDVPKSSPSSHKVYHKLEGIFLNICDRLKVNPAEFDLQIWSRASILRGNL